MQAGSRKAVRGEAPPANQESKSEKTTKKYELFSKAAELLAAGRAATPEEHLHKHLGRGQAAKLGVKTTDKQAHPKAEPKEGSNYFGQGSSRYFETACT